MIDSCPVSLEASDARPVESPQERHDTHVRADEHKSDYQTVYDADHTEGNRKADELADLFKKEQEKLLAPIGGQGLFPGPDFSSAVVDYVAWLLSKGANQLIDYDVVKIIHKREVVGSPLKPTKSAGVDDHKVLIEVLLR